MLLRKDENRIPRYTISSTVGAVNVASITTAIRTCSEVASNWSNGLLASGMKRDNTWANNVIPRRRHAENVIQYQIRCPPQCQPRLRQNGRLPKRVTTTQHRANVIACATMVVLICRSRRGGDIV